MSGENGDGTPTAAEVAELREGLQDLRDAIAELHEARTPGERRDAQEEIRDAKADLDALARELNIPKAALENAARDAQRAQRKDELRPILEELLAEREAPKDEEPEAEKEATPVEDDPKPKPKDDPAPEPEPEPVQRDSAPVRSHWSERPVSELLK